ncbi:MULTISPECIES: FitA-like ribbon-helix-helix domain-containing protein [unclassified Frankia]|uniref:FitA-like ribbon-helix-helix domain-containing protein n=1 Tax=unclassified Frankia TaxID=2632575 RepID=UPI0020246409
MTTVVVRDLPDDIHHRLQERARDAGQSLQQYLTIQLTRLATIPSLDEVINRITTRAGGRVGFQQAVADLDAERH